MRQCIRCLHDKAERKRVGASRSFCVIQCCECGFNVTSDSFEDAERLWDGFRVWELVPARRQGGATP